MKDGSECEIVFEFDDGIIEKYVHFSRVGILMIRVDGLGFKMKLLVCHIWGRDNYNDCWTIYIKMKWIISIFKW